jgi:hypothetical protein
VPGAVRPPSPEHKDPSENPSKRTRNAPRFQPYNPLVKANMLPEDLGQNQNFLRTSPGRLDRPSYAVRPPSPDRTGKRGTAGQPSTLHHPISRFTQRIAAKLWGCLGHLMDDLSLKGIAPKRSQSWGIANLVTKPQELEFQRKPPNRVRFKGDLGAKSPAKEAQKPHT